MAMQVAVVVLGDVGRSPRMQYHAQSLAELPHGAGVKTEVSLVGYRGEECIHDVETHRGIRQFLFSPFGGRLPQKMFILSAPVKAIVVLYRLAHVLLTQIPRPDVILVQNPPSIPSLVVVWL